LYLLFALQSSYSTIAATRLELKLLASAHENLKVTCAKVSSTVQAKPCPIVDVSAQPIQPSLATLLSKVKIPYFCTAAHSDQNAWVEARKKWLLANPRDDFEQKAQWPEVTGPFKTGPSKPAGYPLHWWCDKFPPYDEPFIKTALSPEDLAVGIFSGERFYYSRALAVRATYGSRLPNFKIYASISDGLIGVTGEYL